MTYPRPVPLVGDRTSAAERAGDPAAWAFPPDRRDALHEVIAARRDVRRYRPDPVADDVLERVLTAGHRAPSVGHSQPWRFIVVREPATRERAAWMADQSRVDQAALMEPDSARHLLDLQLEGIREAPLGVVVCCDRRTAAAGVLGRATFPDADLWSCACAIQNLWLAARAEGLGMGWVTLFDPVALGAVLGLPDGVETLGWLCLGWPDERPPAPGLERAGWSRRQPLASVVMAERWTETDAPVSHLRAPSGDAVVGARDDADQLLTPPGSLGVLDRAVDRAVALRHSGLTSGVLVLAAGHHRVLAHGVSAFGDEVTDAVVAAARAGTAVGAVAAAAAGLDVEVVDCGWASGDLVAADALTAAEVDALIARGRANGAHHGARGLVALGEVGMGNTTVAAAVASLLLDLPAHDVVGLGSGADADILERKRAVVDAVRARAGTYGHVESANAAASPDLTASPGGRGRPGGREEPGLPVERVLALAGGPEVAYLTGVALGAASVGAVVVLDGLLTSVAALCAVLLEPAVDQHLVAGQRSRERAHAAVLARLGLEPLLDLRLRAGEGAGACLASGLLLSGLRVRRETARTS